MYPSPSYLYPDSRMLSKNRVFNKHLVKRIRAMTACDICIVAVAERLCQEIPLYDGWLHLSSSVQLNLTGATIL